MGNKYKRPARGADKGAPPAKKARTGAPPRKITVRGPADPALSAYAGPCAVTFCLMMSGCIARRYQPLTTASTPAGQSGARTAASW